MSQLPEMRWCRPAASAPAPAHFWQLRQCLLGAYLLAEPDLAGRRAFAGTQDDIFWRPVLQVDLEVIGILQLEESV